MIGKFTTSRRTNKLTTPQKKTQSQLVNDVLSEEMEEVYNEAAAFWQGLKRELARAIAERAEFLSTPGIAEADLDLSSSEEGGDDDEEEDALGLDGIAIVDSESESVTARRR